MNSTNYLIVEVDTTYINEKSFDDKSIITNSTIEDVSSIQREAVVVSAPEYTILNTGDKVIVHHNIFRSKYNYKGNLTPSDYHIEGNIYFVPLSEVFMYNTPSDSYYKAIDPFVFVEPIKLDESENFLVGIKSRYKGKEHRVGFIKHINKNLLDQGLNIGDKVAFKKNSEYEFNIQGNLLYKMKTSDILLKLN